MNVRKTGYVDLSAHAIELVDTQAAAIGSYLGGRGYAASILYDLVGKDVEPESRENALIISSGLFSGTPWPAASRYHLTFRSPLTGIYGYANAGGKFGPYLAACGFDAVVVQGWADRPVYLLIDKLSIRIEPADELRGKTTGETEALLHAKYPDAAVASIGPAGENGVLFASVMNDGGRAAARTGGGAVFGAKNLKAVVVIKNRPGPVPREFLSLMRAATKKILASPATDNYHRWGTPILVDIKNYVGDLPTKNMQLGQVPFVDRINAEALERFKEKTEGCLGCPIRCARVSRIDEGKYRCRTAGPEYETIDAFGGKCYCSDPQVIIYANFLCNELGMDTLSTGAAIAFAMECHEKGLLYSNELDLSWGNGETIIALINQIAGREGLGALLAQGTRRAAAEIGGEAYRYAMQVKGLEIPSQEPRVAKGFGLGHATSNRGADHLYALPTIDVACLEQVGRDLLPDTMPDLLDTDNERYKPDLVEFSERYCAVADSLGVCKFSTVENYQLYPKDLARGISALGWKIKADELLQIGERIINLERMYNVRLGLSARDDRLPSRFTDESLPVTHDRITVMHKINDFDTMLKRYYLLRGWDENGIPTDEKLRELGLDGLVQEG
ncbi:MAG: aldehyde ferredoxin oxidoreductase family protein [Candidatus Bipolaricaulota bacterium]|nr:aldehyde ferredoxin oxidoreductase family protein [Candidatus Bipolaricaulota bacterium]